MKELLKEMNNSHGWVLFLINEDGENYNFNAHSSGNMNLDDINEMVLKLAEQVKLKQEEVIA